MTTVRGATLEFHPTARLSEEYSDNFFQTTHGSEENFRTILGPGFTLLLNGARTFGALALVVDLAHDTVKNSGDELKVFPSLNANVRYALTPRLALTLSETFVRTDTATVADPFGIRRGRQFSDTNTAGAAVDWVLDQVALQAYYRNVLFINESTGNAGTNTTNATDQRDTITHIGGFNASTRIATDYLIRLGYELSHNDTLDTNKNNGQTDNSNTSHTGFAQVSRTFGLYTTGGISTSYSYQTNESTKIWNGSLFGGYGLPTGLSVAGAVGYSLLNSDTQNDVGTVSVNLNASYRFARALISVGAFRDFRQTAQQGQNFGTVETRTYFGSFLYQITPFINLTLHAQYAENEPTGTGNTNNNGTQKQLIYGAGLNWQILRWLTSSVQFTHTKSTGQGTFDQNNVGGGDYQENRATLSFFATF